MALHKLLNHILKGKIVNSVHGFLKTYTNSTEKPLENIFIYDEAQRAWDQEQVHKSKRKSNNSEPHDLIKIAERFEHSVIIALIGTGQEIYLGEEGGLPIWKEEIERASNGWIIHSSKEVKKELCSENIIVSNKLSLTTSLRTHQALSLQSWVESVLQGNSDKAKPLAKKLFEDSYPIYVSKDLNSFKTYLNHKYEGAQTKSYGLLASSKDKILPKYGINNSFNGTKFSIIDYFFDVNSINYCKK